MPYCPACTSTVLRSATKCESCGAPFLSPSYGLLESRITEEQEAGIPFPKPVPVILGLLGIGGAAWGVMALAAAASQLKGGFLNIVLLGVIGSLYVFSGYCGVRTLQRRPGWVRLNQVLWSIQVPVLISPLVSYSFSTGGFVTAWLQAYPEFRVGFNGWLGSNSTLQLFSRGTFSIGVNLLALGITMYLAKAQRGAA